MKIFFSLFFCLFFSSIQGGVVNSIDPELPQFLIIGTQKGGTSALYEILQRHPQVVQRPHEVHFFDIDAHFNQGVQWYKGQYPRNTGKRTMRGDKSPYYLFHPDAPARAFSLIPHAKLIVVLRNPVDRAYSHYWMNVRIGIENLSFKEALATEEERTSGPDAFIENPRIRYNSKHRMFSYLARGLYLEQIQRWLEYFPQEQLLIIDSNELRNSPKKVISEVLDFLNLPPMDNANFSAGRVHSYPPMDPALRKTLSEYFRPYNEALEQFLNRKFNW